MPLDDLVQLIERLRERIQQHGPALAQSEMLTRYVLIDPLLRILDWDTEDPACVRPEYISSYGRADYALMDKSSPLAVIEAKKLNENMSGNVVAQAINYCLQEGTPYFVIADGQRWAVYETHKPVPIDQKKLLSFDLAQGTAAQVAFQALAIWRRNFTPSDLVPSFAPKSPPASPPVKPEPPLDNGDWVNLANLNRAAGTKPPVLLRLPDATEKPVKFWNQILEHLVRWLHEQRKLTLADCPISVPGPRSPLTYLVHTKPQHLGGHEFHARRQVGDMWVEISWQLKDVVRLARFLVERYGEDPTKLSVKF